MDWLLRWKIVVTEMRVGRALHCIAAGIMVAVVTLLPQTPFARPLSHSHHRSHRIASPEANKQVNYNFDHFPAALKMAVCVYRVRSTHKRIAVPNWFLTVDQSHRLARAGFKVIRYDDGRDHPDTRNDPTPPDNAYFPHYWLRLSPSRILVLFERQPVDVDTENADWLMISRSHGRWYVSALKTAPVPIAIQAEICRGMIWRPANGRFLDIYINHAEKIRPYIKDSYVHVHPYEQVTNDQYTNKASLDLYIDSGTWIDSKSVLVNYSYIYKNEGNDVAEEIYPTLLVLYEKGHWRSEDIGIAAGGE